ncbi:hypothetical protein DFJ73DRAFT_253325 [Zopfochytrium polystomum]|nr:hypothetical protein DFJ73DRAFT_253325 [Zopfochytrium polystomum]
MASSAARMSSSAATARTAGGMGGMMKPTPPPPRGGLLRICSESSFARTASKRANKGTAGLPLAVVAVLLGSACSTPCENALALLLLLGRLIVPPPPPKQDLSENEKSSTSSNSFTFIHSLGSATSFSKENRNEAKKKNKKTEIKCSKTGPLLPWWVRNIDRKEVGRRGQERKRKRRRNRRRKRRRGSPERDAKVFGGRGITRTRIISKTSKA